MEKILVSYLRDSRNVPFGCVVGDKFGRVGVSICNPKDRFNKRMAKAYAAENRKVNQPAPMPRRKIDGVELTTLVSRAIQRMEGRIQKYYGKSQNEISGNLEGRLVIISLDGGYYIGRYEKTRYGFNVFGDFFYNDGGKAATSECWEFCSSEHKHITDVIPNEYIDAQNDPENPLGKWCYVGCGFEVIGIVQKHGGTYPYIIYNGIKIPNGNEVPKLPCYRSEIHVIYNDIKI